MYFLEWKSVNFAYKIPLIFVPKGQINNVPALVQIMAWRRPGDKPLSEPMMDKIPTHICVTRPQWVNSLWPSGDKCRSGSTLAQLMDCCLTAPSQYLNQCWLLISELLWHTYDIVPRLPFCIMSLKITPLKLLPHLPGASVVTSFDTTALLFRVLKLTTKETWSDIPRNITDAEISDRSMNSILRNTRSIIRRARFEQTSEGLFLKNAVGTFSIE